MAGGAFVPGLRLEEALGLFEERGNVCLELTHEFPPD